MTTTLAATKVIGEERMLLENISWDTYEALSDNLGEQSPGVHLAYDNGSLEIMTVSHGHERYGRLIGRLIESLTFELDIPIRGGGSTTLKRKLKKKGLEPDECYWTQNEARIRGKRKLVLPNDPPPDLAVEVEITRTVLDRLPIYAAFGVPEIWRFDGEELHVHELHKGRYREKKQSLAFPFLPLDKIVEFIQQIDETSLIRSFIDWVRSDILPAYEEKKDEDSRQQQQAALTSPRRSAMNVVGKILAADAGAPLAIVAGMDDGNLARVRWNKSCSRR